MGFTGLQGLRLTRRGRVAVLLAAVMLVVSLIGAGARAVASGQYDPVELSVHTVMQGDTLWGFAQMVAEPGQDVRDVVADLQRLNRMDSTDLQVGHSIVLPTRASMTALRSSGVPATTTTSTQNVGHTG